MVEKEQELRPLTEDLRREMMKRGFVCEDDVAAMSATEPRTRRRWAIKPRWLGNVGWYRLDDIQAQLEGEDATGAVL